jgi:hypothetical protein
LAPYSGSAAASLASGSWESDTRLGTDAALPLLACGRPSCAGGVG